MKLSPAVLLRKLILFEVSVIRALSLCIVSVHPACLSSGAIDEHSSAGTDTCQVEPSSVEPAQGGREPASTMVFYPAIVGTEPDDRLLLEE
jgi:hypothetical protein